MNIHASLERDARERRLATFVHGLPVGFQLAGLLGVQYQASPMVTVPMMLAVGGMLGWLPVLALGMGRWRRQGFAADHGREALRWQLTVFLFQALILGAMFLVPSPVEEDLFLSDGYWLLLFLGMLVALVSGLFSVCLAVMAHQGLSFRNPLAIPIPPRARKIRIPAKESGGRRAGDGVQ